jgi:hypothetical protein
MPHPAESGDRSRAVRVAGSDLTDYANLPRRRLKLYLYLNISATACCNELLHVH